MTTLVNRNSFEINGAADFNEYSTTIYGTVEVTLQGRTKRVQAVLRRSLDTTSHLNNEITAYGITGRYMTGKIAWPGSISSREGWKNDSVRFGFDSRSGKHHKATISFA